MPEATADRVSVTYHGIVDGKAQFTYDPPKPDVAVLQPGHYAIIFTLTNTDAIWADPWITWNDQTPPALDSEYTLPMLSGENERVFGTSNTLGSQNTAESFAFTVHVVHNIDGPVENGDPDIVLDPPP